MLGWLAGRSQQVPRPRSSHLPWRRWNVVVAQRSDDTSIVHRVAAIFGRTGTASLSYGRKGFLLHRRGQNLVRKVRHSVVGVVFLSRGLGIYQL